jgi:hypothetical protein
MSNRTLLHPVNGGEVEYAYQGRVNGICSNYCRSEPQKWCQKYIVRYCEQEEDCHSRNLKIQSLDESSNLGYGLLEKVVLYLDKCASSILTVPLLSV